MKMSSDAFCTLQVDHLQMHPLHQSLTHIFKKRRMKAALERADVPVFVRGEEEAEGREDCLLLCTLTHGCIENTSIIEGNLFQK